MDLLKEYDQNTKKKYFYQNILKTCAIVLCVVLSAVYFGNMLFGQYSLDTLLSLEATKKDLNAKIAILKTQNAKSLKDYFELQGLYPK